MKNINSTAAAGRFENSLIDRWVDSQKKLANDTPIPIENVAWYDYSTLALYCKQFGRVIIQHKNTGEILLVDISQQSDEADVDFLQEIQGSVKEARPFEYDFDSLVSIVAFELDRLEDSFNEEWFAYAVRQMYEIDPSIWFLIFTTGRGEDGTVQVTLDREYEKFWQGNDEAA